MVNLSAPHGVFLNSAGWVSKSLKQVRLAVRKSPKQRFAVVILSITAANPPEHPSSQESSSRLVNPFQAKGVHNSGSTNEDISKLGNPRA
jgi:hypothetical protein